MKCKRCGRVSNDVLLENYLIIGGLVAAVALIISCILFSVDICTVLIYLVIGAMGYMFLSKVLGNTKYDKNWLCPKCAPIVAEETRINYEKARAEAYANAPSDIKRLQEEISSLKSNILKEFSKVIKELALRENDISELVNDRTRLSKAITGAARNEDINTMIGLLKDEADLKNNAENRKVDAVTYVSILDLHKRYLERFLLHVEKANKHLVARRFEEAAKTYENVGLDSVAGAIRDQNRIIRTVDMNDLFEKIHRNGLAISYKCPTCHAPIKISDASSVEGLRYCSYCGSVVDIETLRSFLREAVG